MNLFTFTCDVVVTNVEALNEFALDLGGEEYQLPDTLGELVRDVVLRWHATDFAEHGLAWVNCTVEQAPARSWGGDAFTLTVHGQVADYALFMAETRAAYQRCWFDDDWQPRSLDEAAFELLAASNESPSPDECGFNFDTYRFGYTLPHGDRVCG